MEYSINYRQTSYFPPTINIFPLKLTPHKQINLHSTLLQSSNEKLKALHASFPIETKEIKISEETLRRHSDVLATGQQVR